MSMNLRNLRTKPSKPDNIQVMQVGAVKLLGSAGLILEDHSCLMVETIALVTGANKGIGRISRKLAGKGVLVLMGARDRERGERTVAELISLAER
jgi:hypothetical protein